MGVDARRFLQTIITNDMKNVVNPRDAIYGAFLTTK
jgi:folate-binding Fe-S cluster repair protein YgfZ